MDPSEQFPSSNRSSPAVANIGATGTVGAEILHCLGQVQGAAGGTR